ncbi:MAG: NAD(P)H-dependent oxidoreductase subunit E, partial [Deltaproteobacteria bacterium]|nr:NAD(P)H-dependent oxidoreductase subunit E [Deltaproteobacteria bacterium]
MDFKFSEENKKKFDETLKRYPEKRAALLPTLWLVQGQEGWISPEAMETIGGLLDLSPAHVYEVVTFYTMFNRKPIGRHHIQVCNSVCCWLRDSEKTVAHL